MTTIVHELTALQLDKILNLMPQMGGTGRGLRLEQRGTFIKKGDRYDKREPFVLLSTAGIPVQHKNRDYDLFISLGDRERAERFLQLYWDKNQDLDEALQEIVNIKGATVPGRIEDGQLPPWLEDPEVVEAIIYCLDSDVGLIPTRLYPTDGINRFGLITNSLFVDGGDWRYIGVKQIKRLYVAAEAWESSGVTAMACYIEGTEELRKPALKDRAFRQTMYWLEKTDGTESLDRLRVLVGQEKLTVRLGVYGITIVFADGKRDAGEISSNLLDMTPEPYAAHAIESMVLACACAGIGVETSAFKEAIETTVDAVSNQL